MALDVEESKVVEGTSLLEEELLQRKRAEEALWQAEEKYRGIFENAVVGIYQTTINGDYLTANPTLARILGYKSPKELMATVTNIEHQFYVEPGRRAEFIRLIQEQGTVSGFESQVYRKDGSVIWISETGRPLRDANGRVVGFEGTTVDITERKRAEEEIHRRSKELATLYDVSLDVAAQLEIEQLLQTIVEQATRLLSAKAGGIYLYDPAKREIELQVSYGLSKDYTGTRLALGEGVSGKVAESGEPLMVDDYQRWEGRSPLWEGEAIGGVLGVPLKRGDDLLGVLTIEHAPGNTFQEGDSRLVTLFASQAAIAIENARLYEGERRKAAHLTVINEVSRKATSILDLDEMLEEGARSICRGFDYYNVTLFLIDKERQEAVLEAVAGGFEHIAPGEYRQSLDQGIIGWVARTGRSWLANDVSQDPYYIKGFLEEVLTKSELCVPIELGGEVIGALDIQSIHLNAFDETDVAAMETLSGQIAIAIQNARLFETVARGKKEWEETFDSVTDGVYLIDKNHTLLRVNRALAESFGKRPKELIGRNCYEVIHGFDEPWSECPLREVLERKQAITREAEEPRTGRILQLSVYPRLDDEGNAVGSVHVVRDITERRRGEKEIERRNRELAALNAIAATVSGSLDLDEILESALEKVLEITGFESGGIGLVDEARELIVPMIHRGVPQDFLATFAQPRAGDGLRWQSVKSGEAVFFENLPHDPRIRGREALIKEFRAGAYLPLKVKDKSIGFMALGTGHDHHFSPEEKSLLMTIASQIAIAIENARAYERLKTQNLETISALAAAVEAKDPYISGHSEKVTQFAIAIAEKIGLSSDEIEDLQVAALLHDIGKIGIPDSVLNKPARLTSAEFLMIKAHPVIAAEIVGKIEALADLVPIIRHHHERWEGTGYPDGLKGDEIPLLARILAVADGFEAMTSERPYRSARTEEEARAELERGAGSQWDPHVVEVFASMKKEP